MAGKKGLEKRVWSDEENHTICAQALTAGVSVAQTPLSLPSSGKACCKMPSMAAFTMLPRGAYRPDERLVWAVRVAAEFLGNRGGLRTLSAGAR